QSRGKAEVLVAWPGVTIGAAMLATAIRIDAGTEAHVRAVVSGNDRPGRVFQELRFWTGLANALVVKFRLIAQALEAVGRVDGHAAPVNCFAMLRHSVPFTVSEPRPWPSRRTHPRARPHPE